MSLQVATTITGMENPDVLQQNLKIAQNFAPMNPTEMDALRARCKPYGRWALRALQSLLEI